MKLLVSVIIPVYKAESTISKCLDSFMNQTLSGWELILVDDGSPDMSGRICDEYAKNCEVLSDGKGKIRVIHRKNGGVSAARQTGLEASRGEYVIHADPDDWVEPNMLEVLYEKAKADDADMVICDFINEINGKTIYVVQEPTTLLPADVLNDLFGPKVHGSCCNKLVRRECVLKYNTYFPAGINYCEDVCFNVQILRHDIKISYLPEAYYHYVQVNTSLTNQYTLQTLENQLRFVDFLTTQIPQDSLLVVRSKLLIKKLAFRNSVLKKVDFKDLYPEIRKTDDRNPLMKWMYNSAFQGHIKIAMVLLTGYNLFHRFIKGIK